MTCSQYTGIIVEDNRWEEKIAITSHGPYDKRDDAIAKLIEKIQENYFNPMFISIAENSEEFEKLQEEMEHSIGKLEKHGILSLDLSPLFVTFCVSIMINDIKQNDIVYMFD